MPPTTLNDFMVRITPDYQKGYEEGFEDMKRATIKRLRAMIKEVEQLEAFATATATSSSPLTQ